MNEKNTNPSENTEQPTNHCDCAILNDLAIDDMATAMNIEAEKVTKIKSYCRKILSGEVEEDAVKTILAGMAHDEDVKNAESEGYLRGRNEKIKVENHFEKYAEERAYADSVMPRFARRSIWDIED